MEQVQLSVFAMFLVGGFFLLGMSFALAGAYMLLFRSANAGEVKLLAEQTTHLAQKGIAEDVAGLVGNASDLLNSVNQMVRTQAGVGVFLVIAGGVMMVISCWIAIPHI